MLQTHSVNFIYTSPEIFPSLFCICHKILRKWDGFVDNLGIKFHLSNLPCYLGFFTTPSTCLMSSTTLSVMVISLIFKASQECRDVLFHPLEKIYNFYIFWYFGSIESQNVCVCLNFLSNDYSFVVCKPLSFPRLLLFLQM